MWTLRASNSQGEGNDAVPKVAIGFKGDQSSRGGLGVDEGACQTMQSHMSALEPTVAIRTANTHANGQAVAVGVGGVCTNGEPRTGRM